MDGQQREKKRAALFHTREAEARKKMAKLQQEIGLSAKRHAKEQQAALQEVLVGEADNTSSTTTTPTPTASTSVNTAATGGTSHGACHRHRLVRVGEDRMGDIKHRQQCGLDACIIAHAFDQQRQPMPQSGL